MRTRIVFPYILFTGVLLLLVAWLRPHPAPPAASITNPNSAVSAAAPKKTPLPSVGMVLPAMPASMVAAEPDPQDADNRIAGLQMLAMNNDENSLNLILGSLADTDPQIRAAALEATVQFDRPEAIPALQEAMVRTELPQEKLDIQAAIDFLKLPPVNLAQINPPAAANGAPTPWESSGPAGYIGQSSAAGASAETADKSAPQK
jgi:hypothetical protein